MRNSKKNLCKTNIKCFYGGSLGTSENSHELSKARLPLIFQIVQL